MTQTMTVAVGYFGKVPSRGDFVRTADNQQLMALLDRWAGSTIEQLSRNPDWKRLYATRVGITIHAVVHLTPCPFLLRIDCAIERSRHRCDRLSSDMHSRCTVSYQHTQHKEPAPAFTLPVSTVDDRRLTLPISVSLALNVTSSDVRECRR